MITTPEIICDLLSFLDKDQIERIQLVNQFWNNVIVRHKNILPLRQFFRLNFNRDQIHLYVTAEDWSEDLISYIIKFDGTNFSKIKKNVSSRYSQMTVDEVLTNLNNVVYKYIKLDSIDSEDLWDYLLNMMKLVTTKSGGRLRGRFGYWGAGRFGSKLNEIFGNWYTHLILIYLNRQHYDRAELYLQTLLSVVSCGSDGTQRADYHPSMFVKVYPALMNKMIVSLLRCDAHESEMLLTAFANLLRTYRHACARYPEVRRINDQHVVEFCCSSERRHKNWTNDLGELLFKMAALATNAYPSSTMNNPQVKMAFMQEFFARQVHWVHKYWSSPEREMASADNFVAFFHKPSITIDECCEFRQFFEGCQVSLKVMLFNLECLSVLMTPDFEERLDRNYGLLEVDQLQRFREAVIAIKNLDKLSGFFQRANYPIQDSSHALQLVKMAYEDAKTRGYWYENNRVVSPGYNRSRNL